VIHAGHLSHGGQQVVYRLAGVARIGDRPLVLVRDAAPVDRLQAGIEETAQVGGRYRVPRLLDNNMVLNRGFILPNNKFRYL
jgi:hypothetical protein